MSNGLNTNWTSCKERRKKTTRSCFMNVRKSFLTTKIVAEYDLYPSITRKKKKYNAKTETNLYRSVVMAFTV